MAQVGSFTQAVTSIGGGLKKVSIAWTASAGGAVSGGSLQLPAGRIYQAKFVPGNGGTAPTVNYTFTLLDNDGVDLLAGKGSSSMSATVSTIAAIGPIINDPSIGTPPGSVTPTVTAAGNGGQGRVDLLIGP